MTVPLKLAAGVNVQVVPWSMAEEVTLFNTCDIGVYPLPNDEWSKGKCGLKALTYMATGLPTLSSPVGVNTEIVRDGIDGFLPTSEDAWVERMLELTQIEIESIGAKRAPAQRKTSATKSSGTRTTKPKEEA